MDNRRGNRWCAAGGSMAILLVVTLGLSGCEPLRKKFIRKKKAAEPSAAFVPVFVPEEYAPAIAAADGVYDQHYSLALAWCKELQVNLGEDRSDKKLRYAIDEILSQLTAMQSLLDGESRQQAGQLREAALGIQRDLAAAAPFRDKHLLSIRVDELERSLRAQLKTEVVRSDLRP